MSMRQPGRTHLRNGQALVLVLIVLAVLAGGYWFLLSSRDAREQDAHRFAREAAERLFLKQDARFLNQTLSPTVQTLYPPSWRERFFTFVRDLGPAQPDFDVEGRVTFTSEFFTPAGMFRARFNVASGPALLDIHFVHTGVRWEIDSLTLTCSPRATPAPTKTR